MKAVIRFGHGWNTIAIVVETKDIGKAVEMVNSMRFVETEFVDDKLCYLDASRPRKPEIELIEEVLPAKPTAE